MVLWVFGYASLIWKAGFHYDEKVLGFIKDYRRTFHLACIDHRGTPEFPARAANLDPEEGAICWGIAYCIKDDEDAKQVISYLKVRECEYDVQAHVDFFTEESPDKPLISNVLIFITTPDKVNNKYYLGPAPLEEMASQIARARGPSGPSYEYIFCLEEALRAIGHEDEDVIKLAQEVKKILLNLNGSDLDHHSRVKDSNQYHVSGCMHKGNNGLSQQPLNLSHASLTNLNLSNMPHSPRLVKSRAL